MVVPALAALMLSSLWLVALGGSVVPTWALVGVSVAATLTAVVAHRGLVFIGALGVALGGWAAVLASTVPSTQAALPQAGLARLSVEPRRSACGLGGCWAEAAIIDCTPIDPASCAPAGTLLSLSTQDEPPLGARVSLVAKVAARPEFRNPSFGVQWPDTRPLLRARAQAVASLRVEHAGWLARAVHALRGAVRRRLNTSLGPPHNGVARALLLGEGSAVPGELNDAIRNAGVSHVLAVSGMHVTVLVGGLAALVRWLWLHTRLAVYWEARRAAALLGAVLAPLVASICGGSPSAVRAALTSTLMFGITALGRRPSALAVSALAVGLHVAMEPRDAVHPGFVLSVVATAALLTASQASYGGLTRVLRESLRAWVATAPFLALCFGATSLVAILANVVLLPLGGLLIPAAVAQLGAAFLGLDAWLGTRGLFSLASGAFVGASRLCASLDPGLRIPALSGLQLAALSGLACAWLVVDSWRARLLTTGAACVLLGFAEWRIRHVLGANEAHVVFLDVGQGDGALVQTGDGHAALFDAGGSVNGGPDPGQASVLPVLSALRVRKLDVVVMSHPHPDHYGGLEAVLEQIPVGELWDTGQAEAEDAAGAQRIVELARARGIRVRRPDELCGGSHPLGAATLKVYAPCPGFDDAFGPNDNSFVVRLQHGRRSFLFTGDIERAAEAALARKLRRTLKSDVLKVAHHGSRTSSTKPMLEAVAPWLSVVSAGRANRFGHPHAEVVDRLTHQVEQVLRVDEVGGVRVWSDGEQLRVSAWDPDVALQYTGPDD